MADLFDFLNKKIQTNLICNRLIYHGTDKYNRRSRLP